MSSRTFRTFAVLWASLFAAMFGVGMMSPLLPTYAEQLGASGLLLGMIFGGFSLGRMFAMPVVGRLSDRHGRKGFIVLGLGVQGVAAVVFLYCVSPAELLATRMFQGLSGAMIIPIAMAMVGEMSPAGKESTYMGWLTVALFTGFGIGPMVGGVVKDYLSFATNFKLLAILSFVAMAGVLFLLPRGQASPAAASRTVVPYRHLLRNPVLRGMFVYRATNAFGRGVIAAFLPLVGEHVTGLSTTQVGIVLSANLLVTAVFQPLFGRIADRWGRRGLLVSGILIQTISLAAMPWAHTLWTLLALNLIMGFASSLSMPAASGLVTEEGKKGGMGGSMAIFNIGMSIGLASGPIVGGLVFDLTGYVGTFTFGGAMVLLGLVPVFGLQPRKS